MLGHLNFFHDDGAARYRSDDPFCSNPVIFDQLLDRLCDRFGVDHHVILDRVLRKRLNPQLENAVATLIEASFNHFDRAGTDIERNAAVTATERL